MKMTEDELLERPSRTDMRAAMPKATAAPISRPRRTCSQPTYHTEISDEYLDEMQRRVDAAKPKGFKLTPISEPGW